MLVSTLYFELTSGIIALLYYKNSQRMMGFMGATQKKSDFDLTKEL
jgi:hypothetical protein